MASTDFFLALPESKLRDTLVKDKYLVPGTAAKTRALAKYVTIERINELVALTESAENLDLLNMVTAQWAIATLLYGTADDLDQATREAAQAGLDTFTERVIAHGDPAPVGGIWEITDVLQAFAAAQPIRQRADAFCQALPPTANAQWAAEIGLKVPTDTFWDVRFAVPVGEAPMGLSVDLGWMPGIDSFRVAPSNQWWTSGKGYFTPAANPMEGRYVLSELPQTIADVPRTLAEIIATEGASPDWDGFNVKPSRGVTPAKKAIPSWLQAAI